MKTKPKKRAAKYEPKLAVKGTFGQLVRVAAGKKDEVKKELQKK